MNILITGSAGFIGFHLSQALLKLGHTVTGIDNLNDYYDPQLKFERQQELEKFIQSSECRGTFNFTICDISDQNKLSEVFEQGNFEKVINLAAQAGVRYSIKNPKAYIDSNLVGFANILECCRQYMVKHLIYASSSSVYGMNTKIPFSITDNVDHPISLYAATKKSNELMAHTYSHLFNIPTTGLRFFTVYGPWGRPDMAYYSFTQKILKNEPIDIYNFGNMKRDFTYIDDIVDGIVKVFEQTPTAQSSEFTNSPAPYKIYNIGNNNPVTLDRFIKAIELATGKHAIRNNLPMQPGDVPTTYADISEISRDVGFSPSTEVEVGIKHFVNWFNRATR